MRYYKINRKTRQKDKGKQKDRDKILRTINAAIRQTKTKRKNMSLQEQR